jgi:hypothetical protein
VTAALALVMLAGLACADGRTGAWHGTVDTLESGAVLVSNPRMGSWTAESAWRLVEDVRIGTREGWGPDAFGDVADIDVDAGGRIYVLDRQAQDVRVFAPDGSHVRTIGRPGSGPGEFNGVTGIALDPRQRLWVFNQNNLRYSVFDTTGTLLGEPPRRFTDVGAAEWISVFEPEGDMREVFYYPDPTVGIKGALIRYDTATGMALDTSPVPSAPHGTPFGWAHRTLTPHGWWVGVADEYRLWQTTYGGDTLRIVTRSYTPRELSAEQRDSAERHAADLRRRLVGGSLELETRMQPLFRGIVVDDRNYVWVIMVEPADVEGTTLDVFDPDGRYLGAVTASPAIAQRAPVLIRGSVAYWVTKDSLDVPLVVRATIRGRR